MSNNILKLLFRSPRPAAMNDMQASVSRFWCRKGYSGITLFGHIFTRTEEDAERLNKGLIWKAVKNHEMIHLRQAQNTHNSWILFYLLYLWYSALALRFCRRMRKAAYYLNPFEIEAYAHMYDMHYLDTKREHGTDGWRAFAKMSLAARLRYVNKNLGGQVAS